MTGDELVLANEEERRVALLEDQVRFFKAAYGITQSAAVETYQAGLRVLDASVAASPQLGEDAQRLMRASIEVARELEAEQRLRRRLHETLLNVSQAVANALELAAAPDAATPPRWLLSLGSNLDMVLADAALEKR